MTPTDQSHFDRALPSLHQPAEDVEALRVRPENMAATRSQIDAHQVRVELVGGVEHRAEEAEQGNQDNDAHPGDREPVLGERPRHHGPGVARRDDLPALGQYVDVDLCTVDRLGCGALST